MTFGVLNNLPSPQCILMGGKLNPPSQMILYTPSHRVMENESVLEDLKFMGGDGNLLHYLYNVKHPEQSSDKLLTIDC